jgi:hypothetical protein
MDGRASLPGDNDASGMHGGVMANPALRAMAELAATRHGVLAVAEATALGATRSLLRAAVSRGEWERPAPGVLVVAGAPTGWHRDAAVAVVASGGVLSHRAAARLHALDGFDESQVEVTVAHSSSWHRDGTIVHRSRRLDREDLHEVDGIAVTSIARTIADLGAVVDDDLVEQALDDALRQGASALWIETTLHRVTRPGRTGTGALRRTLARPDRKGPLPDSVFERLVERVCTDAGLPPPTRQVRVHDTDGSLVAVIDVGWPDRLVGIEGHSRRWHAGTLRGERDRRRDNRLTALGWELLYASWSDVEHPEELTRLVRATYDRRAPAA